MDDHAKKKMFLTSQATRREHFEFFGKTKALIYENLKSIDDLHYFVKK